MFPSLGGVLVGARNPSRLPNAAASVACDNVAAVFDAGVDAAAIAGVDAAIVAAAAYDSAFLASVAIDRVLVELAAWRQHLDIGKSPQHAAVAESDPCRGDGVIVGVALGGVALGAAEIAFAIEIDEAYAANEQSAAPHSAYFPVLVVAAAVAAGGASFD